MPREKWLDTMPRELPMPCILQEKQVIPTRRFDLHTGDIVQVGVDLRACEVVSVHRYIFRVENSKGIRESFRIKDYMLGLIKVKKVAERKRENEQI